MLKEITKTVKTPRRYVRTTGSLAVNNRIVAVGTIVEVDAHDGIGLNRRNLAVNATQTEVIAAGAGVVIAPVGTNVSWVDA